MTAKYWEHLIYEVSESGTLEPLLRNHPMKIGDSSKFSVAAATHFYPFIVVDLNFTRPLVPFDCEEMGGCGTGTKRIPKKSCAINPTLVDDRYSWEWD
jgi:hypothetical protein